MYEKEEEKKTTTNKIRHMIVLPYNFSMNKNLNEIFVTSRKTFTCELINVNIFFLYIDVVFIHTSEK